MTVVSDEELHSVAGGQKKLNPNAPLRSRDRLLEQCGTQIDTFSTARQDAAGHPSDTRKQIEAIARGRSLTLCAENAGFDPPPQWRFNSNGTGR